MTNGPGASGGPGTAGAAGSERPCPCGVGRSYDRCCGRLHRGEADAVTAEQLMRSRYSAFVVGDEAYLLRSWHPATAPPTVGFDPELEWVGLRVLGSTGGGFADDEGTVEFRASYRRRGNPGELHEHSEFVRLDGRWVYTGPIDAELT